MSDTNASADSIMELFSDKNQMYHGSGVAILIDEIKRLRAELSACDHAKALDEHTIEVLRTELARFTEGMPSKDLCLGGQN